MSRWRVRSLAGQMVLLLGLALLVAQAANFALILNERQKLSLSRNQGPPLTALATVAGDYRQTPQDLRPALLADNSRRGIRLAASRTSGIIAVERDADLEARVREALADAGVAATTVVASSADGRGGGSGRILRVAIQTAPWDEWLTARIYIPRPEPWLGVRLASATVLLYLLVLGASVWLAVRIARPLRDLTSAADLFQGRSEPPHVPERGPDDVRGAISAFNAMGKRVSSLLSEKDHMLGAIGHDLRTPLASVRLRLEALGPPEERAAAIATLDEMGRLLENILSLARTGRPAGDLRRTDVTALVEALVDEYQERGVPIAFSPGNREVAPVHPDLLRQALRNLIDNALKYGNSATLTISGVFDQVAIIIADQGPGIPEDQMAEVLEPFRRLETSRSRTTGGAGLGLAIANNVAKMHGGSLRLETSKPTGLRATMMIPR